MVPRRSTGSQPHQRHSVGRRCWSRSCSCHAFLTRYRVGVVFGCCPGQLTKPLSAIAGRQGLRHGSGAGHAYARPRDEMAAGFAPVRRPIKPRIMRLIGRLVGGWRLCRRGGCGNFYTAGDSGRRRGCSACRAIDLRWRSTRMGRCRHTPNPARSGRSAGRRSSWPDLWPS